jgi:DNA-nicking Smr family endonuclease
MCAKKGGEESLNDSEFRQAMSKSGVEPMQHNQIIHSTPSRSIKVRKTIEDKQPIEDMISDGYEPHVNIQAGDVLSFCRAGIQKRVFRDLRRGRYRIVDELDLHGLTVREAKVLLLQFLMQAEQFDKSCVKVVHGKGRGSETSEPVLKKRTDYWLSAHPRVLAYYSTLPADGGTGAVYVLLKSRY